VNTKSSVKWMLFVVPKYVEQINGYLFIDTQKSNKIKFVQIDELVIKILVSSMLLM